MEEQENAVDFTLPDKDENMHTLSKIDAKYKVVFFYPKDNTPGCTIETQKFNAALSEFKALGAEVIGISGGDAKTKTKFCEKHGFELLLLSDTDFAVSTSYGIYGEKKFMGRTYMGINRDTFIVDEHMKVIKVFRKVKPPVHVGEVLEYLKSL